MADHKAAARKAKARKGTMKGHSIKGGQKRPTKSGAGMTAKGVGRIAVIILGLNLRLL